MEEMLPSQEAQGGGSRTTLLPGPAVAARLELCCCGFSGNRKEHVLSFLPLGVQSPSHIPHG